MHMFRLFAGMVVVWLGLSASAWASKRIVVDLTNQVAIAYQDGQVKFYGRISSGKPGRETPTGSFYVREKDIDHVSNLWPKPNGGAKMHYMLRITRDGIAMHLGPTPDYPASHGCIRMRDGFAQRMYAWAEKYTKVDIIGKAPAHSPELHLPAYAKSKRMLNRSVGGGTHGPLAAMSLNPKDHRTVAPLDPTAGQARSTSRRTTVRRDPHPDPLSAVSGLGPKPASAKRTGKRRAKRTVRRSNTRATRKATRSKRRTTRHSRHRKKRRTERHPDPLRSVSSN